MKRITLFIFAAALCSATIMHSCDGWSIPEEEIVYVTDVTLNKTSISLNVNDKETLTATVAPDEAMVKIVQWSSSDKDVATVSQTGEVTAVAKGKATIQVITFDGSKTATCDVTVNMPFVAVTNITGVPETATSGTPLTLTGTVVPQNATNQTITWSVQSGGNTGATMDENSNNKLNTSWAGTVIVLATVANGKSPDTDFTKEFTINFNAPFVPVTDITDVPTTATAGTPLTLTGTVVPQTATNQTITWSVQNAGNTGATMSGGNTLNTTGPGTVVVTATVVNGASPTANFTKNCTITVNPALTYTISASALTSFGSLPTPYTQPAAQTVTITNTGTGTVTLTQPTSSDYTIGTLSRTSLTAGQTATFTVQPRAGLTVGNHDEIITVIGSNGASATVNASFTVTAALTYTISASALTTFGSLQSPYTQPTAQTVTITNTGTGTVTLTQPTATDYTIGTLSRTSLTAGQTATFTVRPNAGLAVGTYNRTITITGNNGATASVEATFTVSATPTYSISAAPNPNFGSLQSPYTQPTAQTVTVTNTGNSAVTLTQPTAPANYTIGTLSTTNLATNGATATFTVRPNANLAAGTYNPTITINGSNGATTSVTASFTVTPAPTYTITATTINSFGSLPQGYTQPAAQTVTITNTGTGTVTLTQPTSTNYTIGTLSRTSLTAGQTATFTVQPKAGLTQGTYNENIAVSGSNGASAQVSVSFTVTAPLTYTITATPSPLNFGSLIAGYALPAAQTVTIKNTGTGTVTLTQPAAVANYTIGTLSATNLAPNATATFTVCPAANLAAGTYNRTITVTGSNGASASVNANFTVVAATYTISVTPTTLNFGTVATGYAQPAAQTVTVRNTGNSAVTVNALPAVTNYTLTGTFPTTLAPNATATFTVRPNAGLAAGDYNRTITVTTSNGTSATVNANFSVKTITVSPTNGGVPRNNFILLAGQPSGTTFTATTSNIANTTTGSVQWYSDAAGTQTTTAPNRVSISVSTGSATRNVTVTTGTLVSGLPASATAGTYYFRILIDGVLSNVVTLYIFDVTVSLPSGSTTWPVLFSSFNTVSKTFTVTTSIAVSQAATIQWYSDAAGTTTRTASTGVTTSVTAGGTTTRDLTISVAPTTPEGTFYFRVIINGVQSGVYSINVAVPPK